MIKVAGISVLSLGSMEIPESAKVFRQIKDGNYAAAVVADGKLTGAAFIGNTSPGLRLKKIMETQSEIGTITAFDDIIKRSEKS